MSNRTLLEINHDYWMEIDARPKDFIETLQAYLSGGSGRSKEALDRYGIRVIAMRHHSEQFHISGPVDGFPAEYSEKAK